MEADLVDVDPIDEEQLKEACLIIRKFNITLFTDAYEDIPENLILNTILWIILTVLFNFVRNYSLKFNEESFRKSVNQYLYRNKYKHKPMPRSDNLLLSLFSFNWVHATLTIDDDDFLEKCGPEATNFLSFYKHILWLFAVVTFFSVFIALPVHCLGTLQGGIREFGFTTLSNIEATSPYLWIHVALAVSLVPITIYTIRRCAKHVIECTLSSKRTIQIDNIDVSRRNEQAVKKFFEAYFPDVKIVEITFSLRVKKLIALEKMRCSYHDARIYCFRKDESFIRIRKKWWHLFKTRTEHAVEYYENLELEFTEKVLAERQYALDHPLGTAYVMLDSDENALRVINDFPTHNELVWTAELAPCSDDIIWENLEVPTKFSILRIVINNLVIFLVLFFISTPAIVLNLYFNYLGEVTEKYQIGPLISELIPSSLLFLTHFFLPIIIDICEEMIPYKTRSHKMELAFHKKFVFFVLMIFSLPSFGLTSLRAVLHTFIENKSAALRWDCIFLADVGAVYVNYVISCALFGTTLELLRAADWLFYLARVLRIRSSAEKISAHKHITHDFKISERYAETLLIFTICTAYSLIFPLITPVGLLYMSLDYIVEKYNIYYVYDHLVRSGKKNLHFQVLKFMYSAVILLQLALAVYTALKGGPLLIMYFVSTTFAISNVLFLFLTPLTRGESIALKYEQFVDDQRYVPPVITETEHLTRQLSQNKSHANFALLHNRRSGFQ